jgi:hypothetical protein
LRRLALAPEWPLKLYPTALRCNRPSGGRTWWAHFEFKDLREVLTEFHKVDAGSYGFRYPVTTKGDSSLPESFRFNLFRFGDVHEGLFPTLLGAASGVVIEYDELVQAMGEAQEEEARYAAEMGYHDDYDPGDYDPGD